MNSSWRGKYSVLLLFFVFIVVCLVGPLSCGCFTFMMASFCVECGEGCWGAAVRRSTTCRELFVVRCGVDTVFEARWRRKDGTCSGGACKREGSIAIRISWSWETEGGLRKAAVLHGGMQATGDGGDVLWDPPVLAEDRSHCEGFR